MHKKTDIIPAILPKDFAELTEKIELMRGLVKMIQIDVCDGQFTPDPSWPYFKPDVSFQKIVTQEIGMPGWDVLNFEIDLMANKPEEKVDEWVQAGATRIIIHIESKGDIKKAVMDLAGKSEIAVAINIETPVSLIAEKLSGITIGQTDADLILDPNEPVVSCIQCMGIDHIGFQGQAFDIKVIDKIGEIKRLYPNVAISVDGGVSLETAPLLIEAGVNRLVIGSAIFESDNFTEAVAHFKKLGAGI